ncbi:MAG TPA: hypothetical protein VLJ16_09020, partial [Acidobacteriota bacterium]|nr:hypothetical protein [Acidobacteriota bacterium]
MRRQAPPFILLSALALFALFPPRSLGQSGGTAAPAKPRPDDPRTVRSIGAVRASGPIVIDGVLAEPV